MQLRRWHVLLFLAAIIGTVSIGIYAYDKIAAAGRPAAHNIVEASPAAGISPAGAVTPGSATPSADGSPGPGQSSAGQGGSTAPGKIFYQGKVAVLTYHHLDTAESSVTITPERFSSHLKALKDNGFQVIPLEQFADFLLKGTPVPPNAVVITFDDGYESVYKIAYPLLQAQGMTATVFLIVSYVGDGVARTPAILNWNEVEEMHKSGFSFYSHTYNSHDSVFDKKGKELSQLVAKLVNKTTKKPETDADYRKRVLADLTQADDVLNAKLGNPLNILCLPHGDSSPELMKLAAQANIPIILTGNPGLNGPKDRVVKRFNAGSPYMTPALLLKKLAQGR